MWETKVALVMKKVSTAVFVCKDIHSKYTGFPLKSVDYAAIKCK